MTPLPQITGERLVRALERAGFIQVRQQGSHLTMRHRDDPTRRATIPMHGSQVVRLGTLRAILKGAGVTIEELRDLL